MIRFVDLRGQECISRFAFFDTVTDHFIEVDGGQAWEDWAEFIGDCGDSELIARCGRLCPQWVFEKEAPEPEWTTTPPTEPGWYFVREFDCYLRSKRTYSTERKAVWWNGAAAIYWKPMVGSDRIASPFLDHLLWWPVRIEEPPGGKE